MNNPVETKARRFRGLSRVLLIPFLAIAAFFLWTEHRAHLLGALPWILLFACCALMLFGLHHIDKGTDSDSGTSRRAS